MKQIPQLTLTLLLSLGAFCALGQPAPDFSVTDSHGNPHTLYAGDLPSLQCDRTIYAAVV